MARTIKFEGRIISVPDDATDDEITSIVDGGAAKPTPALKQSLGQQFMKGVGNISAAPEVVASMGTGLVGQVLGGFHGLGTMIGGGGLDKAVENVQSTANALTYQPRNEAGKKALDLMGQGFEKVNEKLGDVGGAVGGEVGRSIGETALPVAMTLAPVPKVARAIRQNPTFTAFPKSRPEAGFVTPAGEAVPAKDVLFARQNQGRLAAHELAQKHGIVTNPAETNPTKKNRILTEAAGEGDVNTRLSQTNQPKWNEMARSDPDIDIAAHMPLDENTLGALRNRAGQSSEQIAQLGTMYPTDTHMSQIAGLRQKPTIGGKAAADEINKRVNETLDLIRGGSTDGSVNGASSAELLRNIRELRHDARQFYKDTTGDPTKLAAAEANMKIANILEDIVDTNLTGMADQNPYGGFRELGQQFKNDRRTMAKSYAMEDALDMNTKEIDPHKIAKVGKADNAMTGHFADMGKIVGNFPEAAQINARGKPVLVSHLARNTPLAIAGGIVGAGFGGAAGAGTGLMAGAGLSEIAGRVIANRMSGAKAQARGVSPVPRSMWDLSDIDPLNPRPTPDINTISRDIGGRGTPPPAGMPAGGEPPLLPGPTQHGAPDIYRHPNFQFGENNPYQPPPNSAPPAQAALPEFNAEQVMGTVKRQRGQDYNAAKALDEAAQAEAEATAAALRQPAGEGVVIGGGNNPPVMMEPLVVNPTALQRAVDKIAKGRQFDLTAEERIAWSKANGTIETLRSGRKK